MIKINSEKLKSLIIYYNNSKTQTQDYKHRAFNIYVKNESGVIMIIQKIYYITVLLFMNTKHNIFITVQCDYNNSRYFSHKDNNFLPEYNYFIE